MEYIKEININEAIIHVLDNNSDAPILNEYALDLNEEMYNILLKLIKKCLKNEKLRYATFSNETVGAVRKLSQEYLNGENNLLEVSKGMAQDLFSLMRYKGDVPSCDFITVSFSTEFGPVLGLFKMDYITNYTHSIDIIDDKMSVDIVPQTACLSSGSQKVQKCAFIKVCRKENTFDLMVIDSVGIKDKDEIKYFTKNFLKCDLIDNERDMTKRFIAATENWACNNLREEAGQQERFRSLIKIQLEEKEIINIPDLCDSISRDDDTKDDFIDCMKKYDVAKNVSLDKEYIEKKLKDIRIKIDGDIDLRISKEAYEDRSRFSIRMNGDGSINMIIKNIDSYSEK